MRKNFGDYGRERTIGLPDGKVANGNWYPDNSQVNFNWNHSGNRNSNAGGREEVSRTPKRH